MLEVVQEAFLVSREERSRYVMYDYGITCCYIIYIYRERERDTHIYVYTYTYIYIHTYVVYTYIYIYILCLRTLNYVMSYATIVFYYGIACYSKLCHSIIAC